MKTAQFSPKPAQIVDATTVLSVLKKYEIYKEERRSLSVIQNIDYFIWLQFCLLQIYYFD